MDPTQNSLSTDAAPPLPAAVPSGPVPPPRARPAGIPLALLLAMRPRQWVKNVFVAAPLVFGKSLRDEQRLLRAAAAVAIFCVVSSAVYLWNDIVDVEKDRAHPRKRERPIASGRLPIPIARAAAALFAALGLALAWLLAPSVAAMVGAYLALNFAYSLRLKHIPYVDVLVIATGFVLRVAAGGFAVDVHLSRWLLLCTGLLACCNGFGKRAHELATSGSGTRKALAGYHPERLRWLLWSTGAATTLAYLCYTLAEHTRDYFHTGYMVLTAPFVAVGVGRFLMLVTRRPKAESPTEEMLRDPLFMANILAWGATVLGIIYFAH